MSTSRVITHFIHFYMGLFKILVMAFLGVAVVGGGTYLVMNNTAKVDTDESSEATVGGETNTFMGGDGSLRSLIGLSQKLMCTFTSVVEEGSATKGVVYVDNGNVRGDFDITQSGMMFDSHMIIRDGKMYSWTMMPQGTFAQMFDLDDMESTTTTSAEGSNETVSLDDRVQYDCESWSGDDTKFSLPGGIDFKDMSAMMEASANVGGINGNAPQCAACTQIPDANAKAQCLAALSCN